MIDNIFDMILEEAKTREGNDLTSKLFDVLTEITAKSVEKFEELHPDFFEVLPEDPEELAWNKPSAYREELKRRHDRANLRNDHKGG